MTTPQPAFVSVQRAPVVPRVTNGQRGAIAMRSARHMRSALLADATKGAVCVVVGLTVLRFRAHAAVIAVGAFANTAAAKILKRVLRLPRPSGARKTDPGMPSSHATSLSFLSIAAARSIMRSNFVASTALTSAAGAALIAAAVIATVWRVRCGYHTTPQVVAGWLLGTADWVLWESVVEPRIEGSVQAISGGPVEVALVVTVLVVGAVTFFGAEARQVLQRWR